MGKINTRDIAPRAVLTGMNNGSINVVPKLSSFYGFSIAGAPVFSRLVIPHPSGKNWYLHLEINDATGVTNHEVQITSNNAHDIVQILNTQFTITLPANARAYLEGTSLAIEVTDAGADYYIKILVPSDPNYLNAAYALGFLVDDGDFSTMYGGEITSSPPPSTGALSGDLNFPNSSLVNFGSALTDETINRMGSSLALNIDKLNVSLRKILAVPVKIDINEVSYPDGSLSSRDVNGNILALNLSRLEIDGRKKRLYIEGLNKVTSLNTDATIEDIAKFYGVLDMDDNEIVVHGRRVSVVAVTKGTPTLPGIPLTPDWDNASWKDDTDGAVLGQGWSDSAGTNLLGVNCVKELDAVPTIQANISDIFLKTCIRVVDGSGDPIDLGAQGIDIGDIVEISGHTGVTPFNHDGYYIVDKLLPDNFTTTANCIVSLRAVSEEDRGELNPAPASFGQVSFYARSFANGSTPAVPPPSPWNTDGVWIYFYPAIPPTITNFKLVLTVDFELRDLPIDVLASVAGKAAEEVDERVQEIIRKVKGPMVDDIDDWTKNPFASYWASTTPQPHDPLDYEGDSLLTLEDLGRRMTLNDVYAGASRLADIASYGLGGGYHITSGGPPLTIEKIKGDLRSSVPFAGAADSFFDRSAGEGPFSDGALINQVILRSATANFTHFDVGRLVWFKDDGTATPGSYEGRLAVITKFYSTTEVEIQGWGGALLTYGGGGNSVSFEILNSIFLQPWQGTAKVTNLRSTSRETGNQITPPSIIDWRQSIGEITITTAPEEGTPTHSNLTLSPVIFSPDRETALGIDTIPKGQPFTENIDFERVGVGAEVLLKIGNEFWKNKFWSATLPSAYPVIPLWGANPDPDWSSPTSAWYKGRDFGFNGTTLVEIVQASSPLVHGFYLARILTLDGADQVISIRTLEGAIPALPPTFNGKLIFHGVLEGSYIPYYSPNIGITSFIGMAQNYLSNDRTYADRMAYTSGSVKPLVRIAAVKAINTGDALAGLEIVHRAPGYDTERPADGVGTQYGVTTCMGPGAKVGLLGYGYSRVYPDFENDTGPEATIGIPHVDKIIGVIGAIDTAFYSQNPLNVGIASGVVGLSRDLYSITDLSPVYDATNPPVPAPAGVFISYPYGHTEYSLETGPEGQVKIPKLPFGTYQGSAIVGAQLCTAMETAFRSGTVAGANVRAHTSLTKYLESFRGDWQCRDGNFGVQPRVNFDTGVEEVFNSRFGVNSHLLPLSDKRLYAPLNLYGPFADRSQHLGGHPYYYIQTTNAEEGTKGLWDSIMGVPDLSNTRNHLYAHSNFGTLNDTTFRLQRAFKHTHMARYFGFGDVFYEDCATNPTELITLTHTVISGTRGRISATQVSPNTTLFTKNCIGSELFWIDTAAGEYRSYLIVDVEAPDVAIVIGDAPINPTTLDFVILAQQWDTVGTRDLSVTGEVLSSLVPYKQLLPDDDTMVYPSLGMESKPWDKVYASSWKSPRQNDVDIAGEETFEGVFRGKKVLTSSSIKYPETLGHEWTTVSARNEGVVLPRITGYAKCTDGVPTRAYLSKECAVITSWASAQEGDWNEGLTAYDADNSFGAPLSTYSELAGMYNDLVPVGLGADNKNNYTLALVSLDNLPLGCYVDKIEIFLSARKTCTWKGVGAEPDLAITIGAVCVSSATLDANALETYWPSNNLAKWVTIIEVASGNFWQPRGASIELNSGTPLYIDPDPNEPQSWELWIPLLYWDGLDTGDWEGFLGYEVMIHQVIIHYYYKEIGVDYTDKHLVGETLKTYIHGKIVLP